MKMKIWHIKNVQAIQLKHSKGKFCSIKYTYQKIIKTEINDLSIHLKELGKEQKIILTEGKGKDIKGKKAKINEL